MNSVVIQEPVKISNMLRASTDNPIDLQTRLVSQRIVQTEKYFEDMGQGFATYARKSAR